MVGSDPSKRKDAKRCKQDHHKCKHQDHCCQMLYVGMKGLRNPRNDKCPKLTPEAMTISGIALTNVMGLFIRDNR